MSFFQNTPQDFQDPGIGSKPRIRFPKVPVQEVRNVEQGKGAPLRDPESPLSFNDGSLEQLNASYQMGRKDERIKVNETIIRLVRKYNKTNNHQAAQALIELSDLIQ